MIPAADVNRLPPDDLGLQGRRVWNMVTRLHDDGTPVYLLRPDELMNLERWCRTEDMIVQIEWNLAQVAGTADEHGAGRDFLVPGLQGTVQANPLLAQLRGLHTQAMAAAKALKLPDEIADGVAGARDDTLRGHQAAAAHARWGHKDAGTG